MKRRLLDILACPNDKHFPLELTVKVEREAPGHPFTCETFCAQSGIEVEESPVDPGACGDCATTEVVEGELFCPACQSVFPVLDGIPRLLADQSLADNAIGRDKAKEMRTRDEQAQEYDELKGLKLLSKLEVPKIVELLAAGRGDIVVELGAGTGRLTQVIAGSVSELVAIDFSAASLKRSRGKFDNVNIHWVQGDVNHLPLRDRVCDHAFSCQVFEHLPGTTARNVAVDEAARIIKGPGSFVISVYRDSRFWRFLAAKEGYHPGGIYYYRLSTDEFRDMLGRRFTIEEHLPNVGLYLQVAKCVKKPR